MNFKTPGAYIQEVASLPASVAQVETAIPAFIGYTEKNTNLEVDGIFVPTPVRITSMLEYIEIFGGPFNESVSVNVTTNPIETGGGLIVDVPDGTAFSGHNMYYAIQLFFANGGGPCYIVSVAEYIGSLASGDFLTGLKELEKEDEPTLTVIPEAVNFSDPVGTYNLYKLALDQAEKLQDRFVIIDTTTADELRDNLSSGSSLKYGAAYFPNLLTTMDYAFGEETVSVQFDGASITLETIANGGGDPNQANPTLYNKIKKAISEKLGKVIMPPSPAIAGVYAKVDSTVGVWKAPANVGLNAVAVPVEKLSSEEQGNYNVDPNGKSINVIRCFTGKGNIVWGARTLDGNSGEWKYVPVRRFFNMVEESVKKATERFIFEPNTSNTWVIVRATIENFLNLQWRNGALAGATPEDAYFVRVGLGETMSEADVLEGRMNIEIGMAAVRPAEFIILKFSHKLQEA